MPAPKKPRKRSKRNGKSKVKSPAYSNRLKELWADPEWRAATIAKQKAGLARLKETDPEKCSRFGVPDGMRRKQADKLWAKARKKADRLHAMMVEDGTVAALTDMERVQLTTDTGKPLDKYVDVPTTDEQKASLALKTAMVMVLSPLSNAQTKLAATRTILEYTKKKPAQATDLNVTSAEAWLAQVVKDAKAENEGSDNG